MTIAVPILFKRHRNGGVVMIDRFHRGMTHLLALAATRARLRLGFLAVMFPETDIQILFNIGQMLQNIRNDAFLNGPTEEIQLAHCSLLNGRVAADLKTDPFPPTERIKESFGIRLEFAFVMKMDEELTIFLHVGHVELLGIIGYKPINETETDGARAGQNRQNLLQSSRLIVESLQPPDYKVLFSLDAILKGLACRVHSMDLERRLGLDGHRIFDL